MNKPSDRVCVGRLQAREPSSTLERLRCTPGMRHLTRPVSLSLPPSQRIYCCWSDSVNSIFCPG
jgi:hypothetical protein